VPLSHRTAEPFQAGTEVGELARDAPELAGLEQGIDMPQPAPHLHPGAADGVGGPEHPSRQPGPFGHAVGGAAGQLAGAERVDQRDRAGRGPGRSPGGGQRVPADLPGPVVLTLVDQRLGVPGGYPGAQVVRQLVPRQGLLAEAADLAVPVQGAAGLHHQRGAGEPEPVPPPFRPAADPSRRLLRSGQVATAVQHGGQGQLEPGPFGLIDLPLADRQRLPVQPHGLLERQLVRCHAGRRGVQPSLLRGAQAGGHRRADQRVREPVVAGTVTGQQEARGPAFVQRPSKLSTGTSSIAATTPAEKPVPAI